MIALDRIGEKVFDYGKGVSYLEREANLRQAERYLKAIRDNSDHEGSA